MSARQLRVGALAVAVLISVAGCAGLRPGGSSGGDALRISEVADQGDATRRASLRLVMDGLSRDDRAEHRRALGLYERAIQVDPTNPFAYLAIARHHADNDDPERSLEYLNQAEILFRSEYDESPRVEPHLAGLRGVALDASGRRREADALLARAREEAPGVWSDGRLTAAELR
jgi:tetratricopeptide (TPR) repeat protein